MTSVSCICIFLFFFFSSRRRHTRCSRDWSSDVCSSDLVEVLRRYHKEHPIDPGMSLQALRAAVAAAAPPPPPVLDAVLEVGTRARHLEVTGSVARLARWHPAFDGRKRDLPGHPAPHFPAARW